MSKTILFLALQSLQPNDYLKFVSQATGLAENKVIERRLLYWALFPGDKNVRGVLDYNYEKPVVRDILQRVQKLYADDPNMIRYCDAALSGEAKKNAEAYFNDNPAESRPGPAASAPQSTPVSASTPSVSPAPKIPVVETPASAVERRTPVWSWVFGITALIVIVAVALKRRA
jgi:hypothetical protein